MEKEYYPEKCTVWTKSDSGAEYWITDVELVKNAFGSARTVVCYTDYDDGKISNYDYRKDLDLFLKHFAPKGFTVHGL